MTAILNYDKAIKINSEVADTYSNRGVALHKSGRIKEAISSYENALRITPNDVGIICNKGIAHLEIGEIDWAISELNSAIKIDPKYEYAYANLSTAYFKKAKYVEAIEQSDKAIAMNAHLLEAYITKSNALKGMNELEKALTVLEGSIKIFSDKDIIYFSTITQIYKKINDSYLFKNKSIFIFDPIVGTIEKFL